MNIGDRVRVVKPGNSAHGKLGEVVSFDGDRVVVCSAATGNERKFRARDLEVVEAAPLQQKVLPVPSVVVQPLQTEISLNQYWGDVLDVEPLPVGAEPLQEEVLKLQTVGAEPLQEEVLKLQTVGAEPLSMELGALHSLRDRLIREGALTDCWIETYQRGSTTVCRLQWHQSLSRTPTYFDQKELGEYRKKNQRGKALALLMSLIKLLALET